MGIKSFQHVRHWVDVIVHIFTEAHFRGPPPLKFAFLDQIWQGCPRPNARLSAAWEMHPAFCLIWRIQLVYNLRPRSMCRDLRLKNYADCKTNSQQSLTRIWNLNKHFNNFDFLCIPKKTICPIFVCVFCSRVWFAAHSFVYGCLCEICL